MDEAVEGLPRRDTSNEYEGWVYAKYENTNTRSNAGEHPYVAVSIEPGNESCFQLGVGEG